jgi:uncharacterized delta-60 repeat protein
MQENRFTKQSRLLSISFPLGLSLALGALFVLFLISLVSVASSSLVAAGSSAPGDLDATFGSGGVVTTSVGPDDEYAYDVAIQPDGKIVVVGYADNGSDADFALARYTISGTLDTSFGSGGVVTTPIGPRDDYGWSVAIQPDGKIVAAGYASNGSDEDFALARYTVSGTLDTSFGSNGIVTTPIGSSYDHVYDIALQPDGKIVVVGYANNGSDDDFALVRYTASGTLDTTFGSSGVVTTPIGLDDDHGWSIALQPDGKIVAAGFANNGSDDDFAVVRYHGGGGGFAIYLPLVLRDS